MYHQASTVSYPWMGVKPFLIMILDLLLHFVAGVATVVLTIVMGCLAICAIKFTKIDFNKLFNNTED